MPLRKPRNNANNNNNNAHGSPSLPPLPSHSSSISSSASYFHNAIPPSAFLEHDPYSHPSPSQTQTHVYEQIQEGDENEMSFDPFANTPRPRRKPYSPFEAFEARRSNTMDERPVSVSTTASSESERVVSREVRGFSHAHSQGQGQGRGQGGKQRRSTLSFEIGGPGDETDTDREATHVPAPVAASASVNPSSATQAQTVPKDKTLQRRPSTGDSSLSNSHSPSSHEPEDSASGMGEEVSTSDDSRTKADPLAPPRPRFLVEAGERASWSSQDSELYHGPDASTTSVSAASASAPSSDTELVGSQAHANIGSESDREREKEKNAYAARQHRRRSGSGTASSAIPSATAGGRTGLPPGAAPPSHSQTQNQHQVQSRPPRSTPYQSTRRYSGGAASGAHRRSSSSSIPAPASGTGTVGEALDEEGGDEFYQNPSAEPAGKQAQSMGTGVGTGARTRGGAAPPSSFRGSRTSFSGASVPTVAAVATTTSGVADDAHPLSPNPSEDAQAHQDGEALSSVGHGSSSSAAAEAAAAAAALYAHQYPHNPMGYQYPPSPPPVGSPLPMSPTGQGLIQAGPVYPGGAAYPGGGVGYPYGTMPMHGQQMPMAMQNVGPGQVGSGYATPTPRAPPPHNAYIANSAIARSSMGPSASGSAVDLVPYAARFNGMAMYGGGPHSRRNSVDVSGFVPPQPPFAQNPYGPPGQQGYPPSSPGTPGTPEDHPQHTGTLPRLREPFLSPASRRASSVWAPPTPVMYTAGNLGYAGNAGEGEGRAGSGVFGYAYNGVGSGSNTMLALPGKKEPLPSSALQRKLSMSEKPWVKQRAKGERASWWLTFCIMWIGAVVGAVVIYFGFTNVQKINNSLCSVLDDDFGSFSTDTWTRNVSLGGFGNGEFQMTTSSSDNLYIKNGQLYIMPTLTSDEIGTGSVLDGYTYNLTDCTETWNMSACSATSSKSGNSVINPVKSARISTQQSVSITYGKVEIVAKMPRGDWLWPAIWMLPKDEKYGEWPKSGEIDIVEARGNQPTYPQQGNNYVRSSLNWGPLTGVIASAFGWQYQKRSSYSAGFHTYTLEWTSDFMRISVDSKLRTMLDLNIKKQSFFDKGNFPVTAQNGSTEAVVQDIWEGQPNAAPFDQEFYLIIDLAVGGTSGWFPDNVGGKMWFDGSATAMTDFANAQDEWYGTWPGSDDDRAFRIDSVKMWKLC